MDINDILASLGLDLTNPEVKRGAMEAIDAILQSRQPEMPLGDTGSIPGGDIDIEIDPDLIQPSQKNAPQGGSSDDIEIDDEEDILSQVKHNESEDELDTGGNDGNDSSGSNSGSDADTETDADESGDSANGNPASSGDDTAEPNGSSSSDSEGDAETDGTDRSDEQADPETSSNTSNASDDETDETSNETDEEADDTGDSGAEDSTNDIADYEADGNTEDATGTDTQESDDNNDEDTESDDFDEDDILDDEAKGPFDDEAVATKQKARRIKRERTLTAAKKALADAKTRKVAPALIRELENAIAALETLVEAKAKSIDDISDDEFNMMVNRVFDAISAVGDNSLTFSSDEERELRAQEIKTDIESQKTQAELSAEDVAKIRAETQAVKAREKEAAKYQPRSKVSFKGFQDFLNSLYKAIALQVSTEETSDDSWAALNKRYGGTGVLQPGKKLNELPNKKVPVIDFYFDQSNSWGPKDIEVGNKAVAALADMKEKGQIILNVFYFGDYVSNDIGQTGGGTSGWNEIVRNVIATKATNVVIMTDSDMEDWWRPQNEPPLKYTVPGFVWYLWRNGRNAPRLPRDLKGRGGVQQFSF